MLASIFTAIVRRSLPLAPAFSFDAPSAASGKTLLASCLCVLMGQEPAPLPQCGSDEEQRKRLLAVLREGAPVVFLDNIRGEFSSSALEAFLTSAEFKDRVLGQSEMLTLPTDVLVLFSGNNFLLKGDLYRRVLTTRIDAGTDACRATFPRDNAHGLLAAKLKAAGIKGTDRSIAKWEKEHDDARISDRKRAQKKVQSASRIRAITTAQVGELPIENYSHEHIGELLKSTPCANWIFEENSIFVDEEINNTLTKMKDWSVDMVMEAFDVYINYLKICYSAGAKPLDIEVGSIVPMTSQIIQRQDEVRRENLMFLCAQPLVEPQAGDPAAP